MKFILSQNRIFRANDSIFYGEQCVLQLNSGTVINEFFAKTIVDLLNKKKVDIKQKIKEYEKSCK